MGVTGRRPGSSSSSWSRDEVAGPTHGGAGGGPFGSDQEPQESTTVTPAEIIYHRRVQVLDRAGQTSVTEACRTFGVSRTTYYRWAGRAQRSGLAALLPKDRRPPVLPTATPPTRSRRCWPRRCPPQPSGLGGWSSTWPSVGCGCRPPA